jgi:hypothetical protein
LCSPNSLESVALENSGETSRCVLPTNATHYLTNCTRARGSLGSLGKNLSIFSEPRRSMRFTTPSIASAGMTGFCKSRSVRSRRLVSFASPVSSPASALHVSRSRDLFALCLKHPRDARLLERRVEIGLSSFP